MANPKQQIKKNVMHIDGAENRYFSYKQGDCKLNFTLRVDTKQELADFKALLEQALKDVKQELEREI